MGFTRSERDLKIIQKLSDYPNAEDEMSAEQLKESFDEGSLILQEDLNKLEEELELNGAFHIGADSLDEVDTSGNTVDEKLKYLNEQIKDAALGQIPNGTIVEEKLDPNYSGILAKKNGEEQEGLNAQMVGGMMLGDILTSTVVEGTYTGASGTSGDIIPKEIDLGFRPKFVVIAKTPTTPGATDSKGSIGFILKNTFAYIPDSYTSLSVTLEAEITETGFKLNRRTMNRTSATYNYIAFK